MKDIAHELGVSVVTVSKALRNHPDISLATRERILAKAKDLGYRPNLTARSLVTGRSSLIGLIVPDLIHPFFADIAKALSLALRRQGYFLVLSSSEEDPELEREEIEHMLAHRLDVLIVATCQSGPESLRRTQQGETPLVLLDRSFHELPSHFVGSDDCAAGRLAAEHLLATGCRRIAHIRGPENSVGQGRLNGFRETLKRHGMALPAEYLIQSPRADVEGREDGVDALKRLWRLTSPPDGIFCYNDVIAMGVIGEALVRRISVPDDLAVLGCGNLHYISQLRVPLTSIDQSSGAIGQHAAGLVLEILAAKAHKALLEYREIILQPRLLARESTARVLPQGGKTARVSGQKAGAR